MTPEDMDIVPEHILSALREDGKAHAPAGARVRVLTRLGVAAAAGVAVATHASAASAAVGKAAGTSAAPLAGGALGLGVVKTLALHPILGVVTALSVASGAGLGAYQVLAPEPARPSVVSDVRVAPPVAQTSTPKRETSPEATPEEPREVESGAEPPVPSRAAPQTTAPPAPALVPPPELPKQTPTARLAEQQALLDQARASLRRGDGAGALAIVQGHEARHPVTVFAEERDAIAILALAMAGRSDEARARAEGFSKRFSTSLFLPSIRSSLARVEPKPTPESPE